MVSAGPDKAVAPGAGAHAAIPTKGAGQSALPCHARAGGPPPGDLWRAGGRSRQGGVSRATPGRVHRAGPSLLRGLLAGALWTAARVRGHNMRATSSCPGCGSQHEEEAHVLWDCPSWETARAGWRAWVLQTAERLQLGPLAGWPACLRRAGLLPLALPAGADRRQVDKFLYRLYGMYLAVLAARYAHTRSGE